MNTETKKTIVRYIVYLLFWCVIICLGFLLAPSGGTGRGGMGTGSGSHGSGTGRGQGDSGTDTGKGGTGTNVKSTTTGAAKNMPAAKTPSKSTKQHPPRKVQRQTQQDSPIRVLSPSETSKTAATLYIPGKSSGSGAASGTSTGFFGVKVTGPVIFLLDISGSMMSTTSEGNMNRLQLVKKEMAQTLRDQYAESKKNGSKDHFRVVSFSSGCTLFPDATRSGFNFSSALNVAEATTFVQNLTSHGGTNMMLAWKTIIPIIRREEIRAVYFLSDGEPGDCNAPDLERFLKQEIPELQIHGISMGKSSQLLKNIATQHKGQYKEVF